MEFLFVALQLSSVLALLILFVELWGIFHGLKLAWERGFRKICVFARILDVWLVF